MPETSGPSGKAVASRPFLTIARYVRPYWRAYAAGACLAVIFVIFELASPLVVRTAVNRFESGEMTYPFLGTCFGFLVGLAAVAGVARFFQRSLMINASRLVEYDIRNDYFRHVQRLSQDFFHRMQTGDIMARVTNDLNFVRMFAGPGLMGTTDMLRLPYTFLIMLHFSVRLTWMACLALPFASVLVYLFVMYMHKQSQVVQACYSDLSSKAQENLAGARVVQAYGVADREIASFEGESRRYMRENMWLHIVVSLMWPVIGVVMAFSLLLIIWQGGLMVIGNATTMRLTLDGWRPIFAETPFGLGELTGFIFALMMLAWPLIEFGWVITLYQRGAVGMERISQILTEPTSIDDRAVSGDSRTAIHGRIEFRDVAFAYAGGAPVLEDISFSISPGETLAVLGPTGSGKSSLVSLMVREYDPTDGTVLVDGIDARTIPLGALRAAIGYVPQDTFLFSNTIRNNLTIGRPDAPEDAITQACTIAQFSETVARLENGLETLLGERGINLSGGQKQRLSIARALVREPAILLLDDALSAVDTHTEEEILQQLKGFMAERTSVIISHRVSTVRHADQILVLDEGRIVERGRHAELLESGGLYARMHERQQLEEELEVE